MQLSLAAEVSLMCFFRGRRKQLLTHMPGKMNCTWVWCIFDPSMYSFHTPVCICVKAVRHVEKPLPKQSWWDHLLGSGLGMRRCHLRFSQSPWGKIQAPCVGCIVHYTRVGSRTVSICAYRWARLRVVCSLLNTTTHMHTNEWVISIQIRDNLLKISIDPRLFISWFSENRVQVLLPYSPSQCTLYNNAG